MSSVKKLKDYIENNLEQIGVVGSPSKLSEIKVDIREQATDKNLLGSLCVIPTTQGGKDLFIFGQITEVELRNVWVEQPTIRGIIKQKGPVSPISGEHDLYIGTLSVISVFSYDGVHLSRESLGRVPPTSSPVYIVSKEFMDTFNEIFSGGSRNFTFIGRYYGTDVLIPFEFRDFSKDGLGEAVHLGIFGKTGSGKSWLAKMILLGYAKNEKMGIFIVDPQGEFSLDFRDNTYIKKILSKFKKDVKVIDVSDIRLSYEQKDKTLEALERMLVSISIDQFWKYFGIFTEDKKLLLIKAIIESLDELSKKSKGKVINFDLQNLLTTNFGNVLDYISKSKLEDIYKGEEYQRMLKRTIQRNKTKIKETWLKIAHWFVKSSVGLSNEITMQEVADYIKEEGKIVVVNLSGEEAKRKGMFWDDDIKYFVLNELLSHIKWVAEQEYLNGSILNTLIVLDEAHRFAPYESPNNDELRRLKLTLVDAVRTTRKYGIGWMFISQTFSSIDKEILNQLRVFFIGYGLNYGSEWNRLREIMGGEEVLEIYQTFGDPLVDTGTRRPSFIVKGPIIPFIPTSKAIAIDVLRFPNEFIEANFPDLARES